MTLPIHVFIAWPQDVKEATLGVSPLLFLSVHRNTCCLLHACAHTHAGTPPFFTASSPAGPLFLPEAPPGPLPPHPSCLPACPGCPHILHTFSSRCSIAGGSAQWPRGDGWAGSGCRGPREGELGRMELRAPPAPVSGTGVGEAWTARPYPGSIPPQPAWPCGGYCRPKTDHRDRTGVYSIIPLDL